MGKRDRLDSGRPGGLQATDQFDPSGNGKDPLLALKTVARPDFDDLDQRLPRFACPGSIASDRVLRSSLAAGVLALWTLFRSVVALYLVTLEVIVACRAALGVGADARQIEIWLVDGPSVVFRGWPVFRSRASMFDVPPCEKTRAGDSV